MTEVEKHGTIIGVVAYTQDQKCVAAIRVVTIHGDAGCKSDVAITKPTKSNNVYSCEATVTFDNTFSDNKSQFTFCDKKSEKSSDPVASGDILKVVVRVEYPDGSATKRVLQTESITSSQPDDIIAGGAFAGGSAFELSKPTIS